MAKLSPMKLQKELMENMHDGEYTIDELYGLYQHIMKLQFDLNREPASRGQFRDNLTRWSNVEGSWLVKKGKGKSVRYHKWICHRSCMTRKQLIMTVRRMAQRVLPWPK